MGLAATFSVARIAAQGQIVAGPNRNIAGGPVKWADPSHPFEPGNALKEGDPYGQRQDEVSCALDSRNPSNVMCAFNDYTPTELGSPNDCETRDAWLGTGWSTDGGMTWHNALLPGYPQDGTPEGSASSLHGFSTGADPTIRSGPNGRMYLLGIVFNRPGQTVSCTSPTTTGTQAGGVVFIQTYVNNNNVENDPRPFKPVGQPFILDQGNTGTVFQDKPWLAVGPDGAIHVAYATFVGGSKPHSILWYQTSRDGVTWAKSKLSEGEKVSNGTNIVVHPKTGWVDIVWRRRESSLSTETDAIQFVRSTDGGRSFTSPTTIVSLPDAVRENDLTLVSRPFDQASTPFSFRNISNPAITADALGRVYIAWSERYEHYVTSDTGVQCPKGTLNCVLRRDAVIKLTVGQAAKANANQVNWTTPLPVDQLLTPADNPATRGHQFRPSLWFAFGKLMLSYMHTRDDARMTLFTQKKDQPDPGKPGAKIVTYDETVVPKGDLATAPPKPYKVFNDFIFDIGPTPNVATSDVNPFPVNAQGFLIPQPNILRRHTEDVMALTGDPAPLNASFPNVLPINVTRTKVSRYAMMLKDGVLQQAQGNPLGWALHCGGKCAFAGDYDDAVAPAWLPGANGGPMVPNTAPGPAPTFYVSWTDNRDLRPFKTTLPNDFNRVGLGCVDPNATGTRNQNPYISRLGTGLFVYSHGNQKPLSMGLKRAFTVVFQNAMNSTKTYHATIGNQPPGNGSAPGSASWQQLSQQLDVELSIGPFSSASRVVYARSSDPDAPITVNVYEVPLGGGTLIFRSSLVLNPDRSTPNATQNGQLGLIPDPNIDPNNPNTDEVFTGDTLTPIAAFANIDVTPPTSPDPFAPDPFAPDPFAPDPFAPDPFAVPASYPDPFAPDPFAPDPFAPDPFAYPTMSPQAANPDPFATPPVQTDTVYGFRNESNTSASFAIKTFTTQSGFGTSVCAGCKLQILVAKPSLSPTQRGCELKNVITSALVANVPSPPLTSDPTQLTFDLNDPSAKNLTVSLPPGGQLSVIYRLFDPSGGGTCPGFESTGCIDSFGRKHTVNPTFNPATDLVPAVIAQSVSSNCTVNCSNGGNAAVPVIITTTALPGATYGVPYSQSLSAFGGDGGPYSFSLVSVSPSAPWLSVSGTTISGTPGAAGTFTVTLQATDAGAAHTATKLLTLVVAKAAATINVSNLNQIYDGGAKPVTVSTTPSGLTGVAVTYNGSPAAPSAIGSYAILATLTNANYAASDVNTTLVIVPPLVITTMALPNGTKGVAYSQQTFATGGAPPYTWSIDNISAEFTLPAGLALTTQNDNSGLISGTPTTVQVRSFRLRVTDSAGHATTQDLCIHIDPAPDPGPLTATRATAVTVAQALVGEGVTISNVSYTGAAAALGTFSGGFDATSLNNGIILSSGAVVNIDPPNNSDGATAENNTAGDADLDALGFSTQDAAVLEFDFVVTDPNATALRFDYVFASEEYNEFVYGGFNDVFGFFIKEVSPTPGAYSNYALIPGTTTPVSIDNLNGGNPFGTEPRPHFDLFINNDVQDGGGSIPTQADGLTKVLTLQASVTSTKTYHMKIAIADVGDRALDSWVLIRAHTLAAVCPLVPHP
jgi:hypothetical protein